MGERGLTSEEGRSGREGTAAQSQPVGMRRRWLCPGPGPAPPGASGAAADSWPMGSGGARGASTLMECSVGGEGNPRPIQTAPLSPSPPFSKRHVNHTLPGRTGTDTYRPVIVHLQTRPEVGQADVPIGVQEDVVGFDVPVGETKTHLTPHAHSEGPRPPAAGELGPPGRVSPAGTGQARRQQAHLSPCTSGPGTAHRWGPRRNRKNINR